MIKQMLDPQNIMNHGKICRHEGRFADTDVTLR